MEINLHTVGFGSPSTASVDVLGGKGWGLARMSGLGINVPPAVIVPTTYCQEVLAGTVTAMTIQQDVFAQLEAIEAIFGYMPLFSVRSGAKVSMPGMLDTILNVGLCDATIKQWEKRIGKNAAWDSYRRLVQMFGDVVFNIPPSKYEEILDEIKAAEKVTVDSLVSVEGLKEMTKRFLEITPEFPQSFKMQLRKAIGAVFASWNTERAITYRNIHKYSHDMGTAVVVQSMVFGNLNDNSCTGVLFTRNPSTGEDKTVGDFLINAQGEDVVAGIRTPDPIEKMEAWNPAVFNELMAVAVKLETEAKDMQDIEFTVQDGKLYILQTRNAKRTAYAAVQAAVDMVTSGLITEKEAFTRFDYEQYLKAQKPVIHPDFNVTPNGVGIPASSSFAIGVAAFSSARAVELAAQGKDVILLAKETTPDDIAGMYAAVGILTQTGGTTSHAAVVARGMDKVCVVGCTDLTVKVTDIKGQVTAWELNGALIEEGTKLTIEGITGKVWVNVTVPVVGAEANASVAAIKSWVGKAISFSERVSSGTSGYLDTYTYDSDLNGLKAVIAGFEGVISLDTSKQQMNDFDLELFELVTEFNSDDIKKAKIVALTETAVTKSIHIDIGDFKVTAPIKKTLEKAGYTLLPTITNLEGLVMAAGLVKFGVDFKYDAVSQKVISLKKVSNEIIKPLVFIGDLKNTDSFDDIQLVASSDEALKFLLK